MELVKFTETVFSSRDKKGILTPDSDGYYTVVVGALNTYNSAGEYYTAEGALDLFNSSSSFQRRIKSGALYSEVGHPKKQQGMSMDDFYNRVISIEEKNICGHFSEIRLDFDFGKKNPSLGNPDLIAIIAKVKPAGAKANALQLALENPKQNAAFSVRGLTKNTQANGRIERRLYNIITFDHVSEPGISIADKYMAPGLESHISAECYGVKELTDTIVDVETLKRVLSNNISSLSNISTESNTRDYYSSMLQSLAPKATHNRLSEW